MCFASQLREYGRIVLAASDSGSSRITRCDTAAKGRGYSPNADEANFTLARLLIGGTRNYSKGLGTAEVIPGSSNYHFENGDIFSGKAGISLEITPLGATDFSMQAGQKSYRSYRMQDLYTPAQPL